MAKKGIWTTLAGLAIAGAAVGGAVAYLKKCREANDLDEEEFDDLDYLDEEPASCGCGTERTYTTLPTENHQQEAAAKEEESAGDPEDKPDASHSQENSAEDL